MSRQIIEEIIQAPTREMLWQSFIQKANVQSMVEVGVFKGEFAQYLLENCPNILSYYLIDPWRNLSDWNKPSNLADREFEDLYQQTLKRTEFAREKTTVLRGKTTEVVGQIADQTLDFAYIDGDHTLKGITIDLIQIYEKVRVGGWIGGDDFSPDVWQHLTKFEPTLVFPFALYFAEAMGDRVYGLPHGQFLIEKTAEPSFEFVDLTGRYQHTDLGYQFNPNRIMGIRAKEIAAMPTRFLRRGINFLKKNRRNGGG